MQTSSIIKSLTSDAIRNMKDKPQQLQKAKVVLQFLEATTEGKSVYLSDGEFSQKFMVLKALRPTLHMLMANDVIECVALNYEGKMAVLMNYSIVYSRVNEKIGDPVEFEMIDQATYVKRPTATNLISSRDWQTNNESETIVTNDSKMLMFKDPSNFTKIIHLTPSSLSWAIRARVGAKTNIISYQRGQMFKCLLFDESASIEITFYGELCDKWFNRIHERKCYIFTGADVKPPSKYNQTGHIIELNFGNRADMCEYLVGGEKTLPQHPPVLENLLSLKKGETSRMYSFMAVPILVGEPQEFINKFGKVTHRLSVSIVDQDKTKVDMSIWGEQEDSSKIIPNKVLVFENFKISIYQGNITLSSTPLSRIHDDGFASSDILLKLMKISDLTKSKDFAPAINLSNPIPERKYVDIAEIEEESKFILDNSNKRLAFTTTAYISQFGNHLYYNSCPKEGCSKKVEKLMADSDFYECRNCGLIDSEMEPIPKFMGQVKLTDHSTSIYATFCSDTTGQTIFGCGINELKNLVNDKDKPQSLTDHLNSRLHRQYRVVIFPKLNDYLGERSIKYYISSINETSSQGVIQSINEALLKRTTSLSCVGDSMLAKRDPITEDVIDDGIDYAASHKMVKDK